MGGTAFKDYSFKYVATNNGWGQLEVCLVGTCIAASKLTGSTKARSDGVNNLSGITQDGANMHKYFINNGAKVVNYEFSIPPSPADDIRGKVKEFLQSPGNNKFLYLSGHGDTDGDLLLAPSEYLGARTVFEWLDEAEFLGHITIMVDACYSGKWSKVLVGLIEKHKLQGLFRRSQSAKQYKTFINLRLSSLSNETSGDTSFGGRYTSGCIDALRQEWSWTEQDGSGWGTKVLVGRKPDGNSVLWGTSETEPQTDLAVDFVCDNGKWTWHYPTSRKGYI